MITKFLEIRDNGTMIPVLAIELHADTREERYLLERSGYDEENNNYIVLWQMDGGYGTATSDSFRWGRNRTMSTAHRLIKEFWNELYSGDVVDVEFMLGETTEKKPAERLSMTPPS